MLTICARLGRFMLTRYFSINSPSCFCAPAVTPPTWFMALLNSGDAIAWLAKELNPFSISPIMFCHTATGSLLLSAIGVLQHDPKGLGAPPVRHTILLHHHGHPASHLFAPPPL